MLAGTDDAEDATMIYMITALIEERDDDNDDNHDDNIIMKMIRMMTLISS